VLKNVIDHFLIEVPCPLLVLVLKVFKPIEPHLVLPLGNELNLHLFVCSELLQVPRSTSVANVSKDARLVSQMCVSVHQQVPPRVEHLVLSISHQRHFQLLGFSA